MEVRQFSKGIKGGEGRNFQEDYRFLQKSPKNRHTGHKNGTTGMRRTNGTTRTGTFFSDLTRNTSELAIKIFDKTYLVLGKNLLTQVGLEPAVIGP